MKGKIMKNDPVVGFIVAGVAALVWMLVGDFPGLHETFQWLAGSEELINPRPVWKYVTTAVMGFLMLCLIGRIVVRAFAKNA